MAFRLSRYLHSHKLTNGLMAAYSPFGHQVAFLDAAAWSHLKAGRFHHLPGVALDDLVRRRFLVADCFEETILDAYPAPPVKIAELWLIVSEDCNMACKYCVVEGNIQHNRRQAADAIASMETAAPAMMSRDVALAALRIYLRYLPQVPEVIPRVVFYGGEPLMNKALIKLMVPQIRDLERQWRPQQSPIQILVITNGILYSQALTSLFKKYRVAVSVSIDGMKHHHDSARRTIHGGATFDRVCASLRKYRAAGLNTGICTTIGAHNVADLPDIAVFFSDQFGIPVQFQVPYDIPLGQSNPLYVSMQEAAPAALAAFARLRDRGILEGLAGRRVSQFSQGMFNHHDCNAVGGQIVVVPDGRIGPCHSLVGDPLHFDGDVRRDDCSPFALPVFQQWWRRMPVNMPQCRECAAIALCGGGCPYNALVKRGSIWHKDPQQCEYMLIFIDWLLEDAWGRFNAEDAGQTRLAASF